MLPSFWIWFGVKICLWLESFHDQQWLLWETFFGVVLRDFMIFTPFSRVLLRLLITLIVLWLGLVFLRVTIFSLSLFFWLGPPFPCFSCEEFAYPNSHLFCLIFCYLDSVSIIHAQWGDFKKLHFCLNVSMQTTIVFENQMLLKVFDTEFGVQGMGNIGEI